MPIPRRSHQTASCEKLGARLRRYAPHRRLILIGYGVLAFGVILLVGPLLGREIFPQVTGGQFQLRFRAPTGTRVDVTEQMALQILEQIGKVAGPANVQTTLGYVGTIPSTYPINTVFLWTSGPHEGVLRVAIRPNSHISMNELKERLRKALTQQFPTAQFSFESGDVVSQIMNFGAPTPIEIAVAGPNLATDRSYAEKVRTELSEMHALRDLQFEEPLDPPSLDVHINRELAGQLGVTVKQAGLALADATSSSRFVTPVYWADPTSGVAYQVQVEFPQPSMTNLQDLNNIPVMPGGAPHPLLGNIAQITPGVITGEYDRFNGQRMLSLTANVSGEDLGRAAKRVGQAIQRAGAQPRGVSVAVRGQIAPMKETLSDLGIGLLIAIVVVFLLLAASFQSMRLSLVVLSTIPTVIAGVIFALLVTGTTLNIQSFMGAIMAIGVSVANAILLVVFAEQNRKEQNSALDAAIHATQSRMRPILMTSMAMVAGMIPMALALGAGAEETAKPRDIVTPGVVEVIIQQDGWKQAESQWRARSEPLDDLPGTLIFLVRIGAHQVEVELVGVRFGQEVAATGEIFEIKELIFFQAMHGFHVALIGVRRWGNARVLTRAERGGKTGWFSTAIMAADEFGTIVGLPDQIAQLPAGRAAAPAARNAEYRLNPWYRR